MEIRSYRDVFDLERRIYRVDALRLNPSGVPVRALGYLASFVAAAVLASRLPLLGTALGILPWFVRDAAIPALAAFAATAVRIEGRSCRHGVGALVKSSILRAETELGPRRVPHSWTPPELVFIPDGSDGRLRRMTYRGPGVAAIHVAHVWRSRPARVGRSPAIVLSSAGEGDRDAPPQRIAVDAGARLVVGPDSTPG